MRTLYVAVSRNPDVCELLCLGPPKAERLRRELSPAGELEAHAANAKPLGDLLPA
jgi:hypothetical protein